jgi:hypothetical protein
MSRPDRIFTDPEYANAYEYKDQFQPKDDADYGWVSTYAVFIYNQLQAIETSLDSKAESIVKLMGGASGLLSIGAIINMDKLIALNGPTRLSIAFSLIIALFSVGLAIWARVPRNTVLPPSIAWALEYVEGYESQSESRFLAQWHLACEGIRLSNRAKSICVRIASWMGLASVLLLAISFFIAMATISKAPPKKETAEPTTTQQPTLIRNIINMTENSPSSSGTDSAPAEPQPTAAPAPNPASQPQTPPAAKVASPQAAAGPLILSEDNGPAANAGPQTIQKSMDTTNESKRSD